MHAVLGFCFINNERQNLNKQISKDITTEKARKLLGKRKNLLQNTILHKHQHQPF